MTKSGKHKKEFRKEKNKIKLKASKVIKSKTQFLPKGLNVTNTSFKTKKIVLSDVLRPDETSGLPLTSRKQTFKELLSHLNHVNSSIQQDGIHGMKELLEKFPEVIEANLSTILGKITELVCSQEAAVRKASLKFLEHVFKSIKAENISPFYPLLNAQLLCAMNHISLDIQRDSHVLLDTMLTHAPKLVSTTAMMILPNFLDQISCQDSAKGGRRILAIQPSQKLTSLKWRREVLIRINRLLNLLEDSGKLKSLDCITVQGDTVYQCGLYSRRRWKTQLNLSQNDLVNDRSKITNSKVREFSSHLLPLIIETWVEASSSEQLDLTEGSSLIGVDTSELLKISVNLIIQLWKMINASENQTELVEWFDKTHSQALIRHFVLPFPFYSRIERKRGSRSSDGECWEQNLTICFLWSLLSTKNISKNAKAVFSYLSDFLCKRERAPLSDKDLDVVKKILLASVHKKNVGPLVDQLVQSMVQVSEENSSNVKDRIAISKLLMNIGSTLDGTFSIPTLSKWIETCPKLLGDKSYRSLLGNLNYVLSRNVTSRSLGQQEAHNFLSLSETLDESNPELLKETFNYLFWTWDSANQDCDSKLTALTQVAERLSDSPTKAYCLGILQVISKN